MVERENKTGAMAQAGKFADKALQMLRNYPRVSLNNLKDMPGAAKKVLYKI